MDNCKHLYVIDGNSLLFRAYFATSYGGSESIMRTSGGIPTNAIFAFSNMILKILGSFRGGESVFVGFDCDSKTFRKEEFQDYKANRKPAPEDLILQFPISREMLRVLGVCHYEEHGVEADDLCGTVAKLASGKGYKVDVYTSDKDYLQLVDDNITVNLLKTGLSSMNPITPEEMVKQFGFTPKQIIDFKGLRGDSSDNLPGIKGIGDKGATTLIQTYGSFDAIVEAAKKGEIKGKTGEKIVEGEAMGRMCYELATIKTDCALPFALEDLLYSGYEEAPAKEFAEKYELRSFVSKLPTLFKKGEKEELPEPKRIVSFEGLSFPNKIGLALDLDESNPHEASLNGIAISFGQEVYYEDAAAMKADEILKNALVDPAISKCVYDAKLVEVGLDRIDWSIQGVSFDLLLASYLLDSVCGDAESVASSFGIAFKKQALSLLDPCEVEVTSTLAFLSLAKESSLRTSLESNASYSLYEKIEFPLSFVLAKMEKEGIPAHREVLQEIGKDFEFKMRSAEDQVYALAGHPFNIASPKQVATVLFQEMNLPHGRSASTSAETLLALSQEAPIAGKILEYRKYAKLLGTYVEGLLPHIAKDGKIHTSFNQTQTSTGRLSSSNPNLQNISVRDEEGKQVRKAFYYDDPDTYLLSLDYHQIELRILAALSGCKAYQKVFAEDRDVHEETARKIFRVPDGEEVPHELRRRAKAINFAIIYGTTPWGLADQIGCSSSEASAVIDAFYEAYPEIKTYLSSIIEQVQKKGYVETLTGRRRYLKDITDPSYMKREAAKRAALNAPVQGSAADLIKIAMLSIDSYLSEKKHKTKMVLQIHDELLFAGPEEELEAMIPDLSRLMTEAISLPVKLTVEPSIGKTWYEAKD